MSHPAPPARFPSVPLLDVPMDAGLDAILARCRDLVEDTDFPTVARWREAGGKVLAHFQVYFPEEIAHAAGMLPVKLRGAPIERRESDARFGSYLCSIVRSSLEVALSGRLVPDLFVTHPICDAARNLAGVWARALPDVPAWILQLPQNPNSAYTSTWLRREYARLAEMIAGIVGRAPSDDELRDSILVYNRNRALLRELYAIKRETPWLLAADEAYVLTALAGIAPREEHNRVLERVLPLLRARPEHRRDRIRVVFEGGFCEQPPLDLLRSIAQFCDVVDDDFLIGLRWIEEDVPVDGDPLANLAVAYLDHSSYSPVQHDLRKPKERMFLERLRGARGEAAVVAAAKMCEPGLDEQVAYARALDEAGIPYFVTEFEERMTGFEHLQIQLETFAENILFE